MSVSRVSVLVGVAAGLLANTAASMNIETVPVGDPGNVADTRYATPGYGSVGYTYNIGKYEVTAGQYTAFLNTVAGVDSHTLYKTDMSRTDYGSGIARSGGGTVANPYTYSVAAAFANRPVNRVSYWDACRFANWLHNGQPTGAQGPGTTETGAYTLTTESISNNTVVRNAGWSWAVTSEDEWYKAAYYKGGSTSAGYWDFPTGTNTVPGRDMADSSGNNANYYNPGDIPYPIDAGRYTTLVGEFQNSAGYYGTLDQGGNVFEWNEAAISGSYRGVRGGSWAYTDDYLLASYRDWFNFPQNWNVYTGFRVVQIPEPATCVFLALGSLALWRRRWR